MGAACRYLAVEAVSLWAAERGFVFPLGTMAVNIVGCVVIGVFAGLAETRHLFGEEGRLLVVVGLLGGFTTFSSFGQETFQLLRQGQAAAACINSAVQVVVGVAAVWAGLRLTTIGG